MKKACEVSLQKKLTEQVHKEYSQSIEENSQDFKKKLVKYDLLKNCLSTFFSCRILSIEEVLLTVFLFTEKFFQQKVSRDECHKNTVHKRRNNCKFTLICEN